MTPGQASGESPAPSDDASFFLNLLVLLRIAVPLLLGWPEEAENSPAKAVVPLVTFSRGKGSDPSPWF